METLKKYWKFLVGGLLTLFSVLLFFRKKDDTPDILEKTTESGNNAFKKIIEEKESFDKKNEELESAHKVKIENIKEVYEKNKVKMNSHLRRKIQKAIEDGDEKRATQLLSNATGIKNLD